MNFNPNATEVKANIEQKLSRLFGTTAADASREQMYKAVVQTVKDILAEKRSEFKATTNKQGGKRVYYMCMEFLLGRSLKTNLCNLGLSANYTDALKAMGFSLDDLFECEPDAQGRILIPQTLRDYAELKKDVTVIGMIDHVEIWDSAKWKAYNDCTDTEEIADMMDLLGV